MHLEMPFGQRPTAVFAFNDSQANDVYDIAASRGLSVPNDLSIVGFDNSLVAELIRPGLTTIDNALEGQARGAIAQLQTLWKRESASAADTNALEAPRIGPLRIPTRLIVRESTTLAPI
jgi:DNA-binding LacI/PurR family transcriptional regulator